MAPPGETGSASDPLLLHLLYEAPGLPAGELPASLAASYGGDLGFSDPCLYANFVASLDGVVALGPAQVSSGSAISAGEPADRFVMALLRALADVVLIGAGTLRATPGHRWTPAHVWPAGADDFAELRQRLGRPADPLLVVVSAGGDIPLDHPGLEVGSLVATTSRGAARLEGRLPDACTTLVLGDGPALPMASLLGALATRGWHRVLTEGGPSLLGQLVGADLLDELFLTVSPLLAGRSATARPGLVAGVELLPGRGNPAELLSARRRGSYLLLRYRLPHHRPRRTA